MNQGSLAGWCIAVQLLQQCSSALGWQYLLDDRAFHFILEFSPTKARIDPFLQYPLFHYFSVLILPDIICLLSPLLCLATCHSIASRDCDCRFIIFLPSKHLLLSRLHLFSEHPGFLIMKMYNGNNISICDCLFPKCARLSVRHPVGQQLNCA